MKVLRAIILAGGYAKRMGQLAAELAKSLLPIAGRPAIDYILGRLNEVAWMVVTGFKFVELGFYLIRLGGAKD